VRDQFLSELTSKHLQSLEEFNAYLWAWVESIYHRHPRSALNGLTPLQRWQKDLSITRSLGSYASHLDELFYHRIQRKVRKDGTVSFRGQRFEIPYELSNRNVQLVVDPHGEQVMKWNLWTANHWDKPRRWISSPTAIAVGISRW
jgi:hypothetical protein